MQNAVLILTGGYDFQAAAVSAALTVLGSDHAVVDQSDLTGPMPISLKPETCVARVGDFELGDRRLTVWNRNPPRSFSFSGRVDPDDHQHIADGFLSALTAVSLLLDDAFAVNPLDSITRADSILHLKHAARIGFDVPRTLISNRPRDIAAFARTVDRLCVKPPVPHVWVEGDLQFQTYTAEIPDVSALTDESASLMPMIYQAYVPKAYEVRVAVFGNVCVATRINSQTSKAGTVDWRKSRPDAGLLEPMDLPPEIRHRCRALLRVLNLRFGAFDFVVRPDGGWVFLEVNQAGQFVWQEDFCPEQRVVEPFARYLASGNEEFEWCASESTDDLSLAEIRRSLQTGDIGARAGCRGQG